MTKSKLTRNKLKEVIKECLIEILAEGIAPGRPLKKKTTARTKKARTATPRQRQTAPDSSNFDRRIQETTSVLTSDPVMAAIFEDTARTTLQEQISAPGHHPTASPRGRIDEGPVHPDNPEDLFEGSSNWATLAFAEKKPV